MCLTELKDIPIPENAISLLRSNGGAHLPHIDCKAGNVTP